MLWYVYYKNEQLKTKCRCFGRDENAAKCFASKVGGSAYMGF